MRVLLVSTYELGHQPVHVASPAARLLADGHEVRVRDLSVEQWDRADIEWADALAFSVPMHTAARLAVQAARTARLQRPDLPIAMYGLYAGVARDDEWGSIAGEYEPRLAAWVYGARDHDIVDLTRTTYAVPARQLLPPLDRYARLAIGCDERLTAAVEASHGCAHKCRHCPVPVVYGGRVRAIDEDIVLADVAQVVELGAQHISFADPDFLNAVHHAHRVVAAVHAAFPEVTFDITTKVEHILRYPDIWREMAAAGCLFVVSAVESMNDRILALLDKGHTAADASRAVVLLRESGVEMRPSFLPFTPWTTRDDLADLCEFVAAHDLVGNVDPIQLTIRLLIPPGSLLLDRVSATPFDGESLSYGWSSELDPLQRELAALVETAVAADEANEQTFAAIATRLGVDLAAVPLASQGPPGPRPRLTEPWFCCAEPSGEQFVPLAWGDGNR